MVDFLIYTQEFCPYCKNAKDFILSKGFSFEEKIIVDKDGEKYNMEEFRKKTNNAKTLPQIFDIRNNKEVYIGDHLKLREYKF